MPKKGSPEMKAKMAKLRAMKGKKGKGVKLDKLMAVGKKVLEVGKKGYEIGKKAHETLGKIEKTTGIKVSDLAKLAGLKKTAGVASALGHGKRRGGAAITENRSGVYATGNSAPPQPFFPNSAGLYTGQLVF